MNIRPRNLLQAPRGRLSPDENSGSRRLFEVSGMVCDGVCARRVRHALSRHPGVSGAEHIPGSSRFRLTLAEGVGEADLDDAVQGAVVLRPLRLALARLAGKASASKK